MRIIKSVAFGVSRLLRVHEMQESLTNRMLIKSAMEEGELRLHLGCGAQVLGGWVNVDMRSRPGVVVMKLPEGLERLDNNSVRYIYASHLLEHLEYPGEALATVRECYRILSPGGVLRIVVPGIQQIIQAYVQDDQAFFKTQEQHHPSWCTTKLEHLMYALQQDGEHKYGYDFDTLSKLLSQAEFSSIVESTYGESQVEGQGIDYRGNDLSLFVSAIK